MIERFLLYAFLTVLLLASACEETPCTSVFTSEFEIEYFNIVYTETDSETVEQPDIIFNKVFAIGNEDSLLVENESAVSIILPVDPDSDFSTFVIETMDTTTIEDSTLIFMDTLRVGYKRRQRLISEDCGPEQLYIDFEILETTYDSLNLTQDQLRTTNSRFLEIYY